MTSDKENQKTSTPPSGGTVRFHRVLKAPSERIYKAVLDPAANAKWLPPNGFTCTVHHLDAKPGGTFRMSFTNFSTGKSQAFHGTYVELVAAERIVMTDQFEPGGPPGQIRTTYTFKPISVGTELSIVQENIPAEIPPEACYLGWQESLENLARLVEPTIPDV